MYKENGPSLSMGEQLRWWGKSKILRVIHGKILNFVKTKDKLTEINQILKTFLLVLHCSYVILCIVLGYQSFHWLPRIGMAGMSSLQPACNNNREYYISCTPPIAEIIWVKNVRAIVVCGFLMKQLKKYMYPENLKKIVGGVWELPAK